VKVTVLAGGVGGAKFVKGLLLAVNDLPGSAEITVVANTGDDMWLTGLRICPDLDSIMYALAGVNDVERGWGRSDESSRVSEELSAFGVGWPWFTLQDRDLGTHIARTSLLREGFPLSEVTRRLASRWSLPVTLLPASDQEVETWVELPEVDGEPSLVHFEEWWVRLRARVEPLRFLQRGVESALPAPGVVDAIQEADLVLFAPSNPVVSIGTMTGFPGAHGRVGVSGIPGIAEALRNASGPVVGVSPIISGAVIRGMGDVCLRAVGRPVSAVGVGSAYGARRRDTAHGLLDGWLVDLADADAVPVLEGEGIATVAAPLWLSDDTLATGVARAALALAERLHP
jgi:LPPG:FO 2-phospho-L-lactate transferase